MCPAPKRARIRLACACVAMLLAAPTHADTRLILRRGDIPPDAPVLAITPHGVAVETRFAVDARDADIVRWDRVLAVQGDLAQQAARYADIAEDAWRARVRLERHDIVGAEPIFERLLARYRDDPGPMRAFAAEGLARCRLARAASNAAVEPWLIWLADTSGPSARAPRAAPPLAEAPAMDESTGLLPDLPPMFLPSPALAAAVASGPPLLAPDDAEASAAPASRASLLAWWYHAAMRQAQSRAAVDADAPPPADPAAAFVADIVRARADDPEARAAARTRLRARLAGRVDPQAPREDWARAWTLAAIGRSLILERDPDDKRRGVLDLLTVASAYGAAQPNLAALALADAAITLHDLGLLREAAWVRRELNTRYPARSARDWSALQEWPDPPELDISRAPAETTPRDDDEDETDDRDTGAPPLSAAPTEILCTC